MFTVLHVEHNRFFHEIVRNMIADEELNYIPVKSPKEAFKILESTKINLIITGLIFEGETGEQLIENLHKSRYKNLPVLILSATEDEDMKNKKFEHGEIEFINKNTAMSKFKYYVNKYVNRDETYDKLNKIKIAVLDDNELELKIIQKMFALNNVTQVDYYSDPETFLQSKEEYSLYLIDYMLPKMSGEKVIAELRKKYKSALIFAISSIENEAVISNIMYAGANDYIIKPINEEIFLARIKANLTTYLLQRDSNIRNIIQEKDVNLDGLTNLYNRKYTFKRLEEEVKRHNRFKESLSLVIFNVDRFKRVNTVYGHEFGDEVLIKIGNILKNQVRLTDILGRFGGEEFILILPGTDLQGAIILCDKLRNAIEDTDFGTDELTMTVSGGVVEANNEEPIELIDKANELMLRGKQNGRNRIEF